MVPGLAGSRGAAAPRGGRGRGGRPRCDGYVLCVCGAGCLAAPGAGGDAVPGGVFARAPTLPFKQPGGCRGLRQGAAGMSRSPGAGGVETTYFNTPPPGRSWVYLAGFKCAEANKGIKHQRCRPGQRALPVRLGRAGRASRRGVAWGPGAVEALTPNPPAPRLRPPSLRLFRKP